MTSLGILILILSSHKVWKKRFLVGKGTGNVWKKSFSRNISFCAFITGLIAKKDLSWVSSVKSQIFFILVNSSAVSKNKSLKKSFEWIEVQGLCEPRFQSLSLLHIPERVGAGHVPPRIWEPGRELYLELYGTKKVVFIFMKGSIKLNLYWQAEIGVVFFVSSSPCDHVSVR